MNYRILIITVALTSISLQSYGEIITDKENPHKKSFFLSLGGGGGLSLLKYSDGNDPYYQPEITGSYLRPCLSTNFRLGLKVSNRLIICWNGRTNFFKSVEDATEKKEFLGGGGAGLGVLYFPGDEKRKIYINGLFGYSNIFKGLSDINNFGTEILFGAGSMITNNISTELNIQFGTSEKSYGSHIIKNPLIINLTLNYLFY